MEAREIAVMATPAVLTHADPWCAFDTRTPVQHPRRVLSFSRRLPAVLLALALVVGQASVCTGWMATAEARMACCSDDGACPMHTSDSERDGPTPVVSQAEADRCCAASEQGDSPSPTKVASSIALGPPIDPVPALIQEPEAHAPVWPARVLGPAAHVPKHLLLSVFLV